MSWVLLLALIPVIVSAATISYWSFDDQANPGRDYVGINHGTLQNSPTWTSSGHNNGAISFDGTNDYIDCGKDTSLSPESFTITAWINLRALSTENLVARKAENPYEGWAFFIQGASQPKLSFSYFYGNGTTATQQNLAANTNLQVNNWYHIAITVINGNSVRFYLNGALDGERTLTQRFTYPDRSLTIGKSESGYFGGYTNGMIDEIRIYNHILSAEEILAQYKGSTGTGNKADLNNDGIIDLSDLAIVAANFGKTPFDTRADTNNDGVVDIYDVVYVASRVGTTPTTCIDEDHDEYYAISSECPQGNDCNDNNPYINPLSIELCGDRIDNDCDAQIDCSKTIPILAWMSIPFELLTSERLNKMKEAGFTDHYGGYYNAPSQEMKQALNLSKQAGLKIMCNAYLLKYNVQDVINFITDYGSDPYVAGFFLWDEPEPSMLDASDPSGLCYKVKQIEAVKPGANLYVNLFPDYWSGFGSFPGSLTSWGNYIDAFVQNCNPNFLSMDFYPVVNRSNNISLRPDWYGSLEIIKAKSQAYNKPWWGFVLSSGNSPRFPGYPEPTLGHMRLQAFSNLVYGAQEIQYFTYQTLAGGSISPIDANGNPTVVWTRVKEVNYKVKELSGVFLGAKIDQVRHYKEIPQGTTAFNPDSIITSLTSGNPLVVSLITNGAKKYVAIVNKDFNNNATITASIIGKNYVFTLLPGDINVFRYQ